MQDDAKHPNRQDKERGQRTDCSSLQSAIGFVNCLIDRVPILQGDYLQHIQDNDELLPHVFMGDVSRRFEELVTSGNDLQIDIAYELLRVLEDHARLGDPDVDNLIVVSFIEHVLVLPEPAQVVRKRAGTHLQRLIAEYDDWESR